MLVAMAKHPEAKKRTREHVIADLSVNYVQKLFLERGHICDPLPKDYGYDLFVMTCDPDGYLESGSIYLQLKATDAIAAHHVGDHLWYAVDVALYH